MLWEGTCTSNAIYIHNTIQYNTSIPYTMFMMICLSLLVFNSWGYIEAVNELVTHQWQDLSTLGHIVLATGSGGTAVGLTVGIALAAAASAATGNKSIPKIHAIGVCDNPDYFYTQAAIIADEMGFVVPIQGMTMEEFCRNHMNVYQGKGLGYAVSTEEELKFVIDFARETGIALDPVYSGKALYNFIENVMKEDAVSFEGSNTLFWHTGGGKKKNFDICAATYCCCTAIKCACLC